MADGVPTEVQIPAVEIGANRPPIKVPEKPRITPGAQSIVEVIKPGNEPSATLDLIATQGEGQIIGPAPAEPKPSSEKPTSPFATHIEEQAAIQQMQAFLRGAQTQEQPRAASPLTPPGMPDLFGVRQAWNAALEAQHGTRPITGTRNETHEENQDKLEGKLQHYAQKGEELAQLVYSPEGQQEIIEMRENLLAAYRESHPPPTVKPDQYMHIDAIAAFEAGAKIENQKLRESWLETTQARRDAFMRGDRVDERTMNALIGKRPDLNQDQRSELIRLTGARIQDMALAERYRASDQLPVDDRPSVLQPIDIPRANDHKRRAESLIMSDRFADGWASVKNRVQSEASSGPITSSGPEQPDKAGLAVPEPTEPQTSVQATDEKGGIERGLVDPNAVDPAVQAEQVENLIRAETLDIGNFYNLISTEKGRDAVYNHYRAIAPFTERPDSGKAQLILDLLEWGEDGFRKRYPDAKVINLNNITRDKSPDGR